MVSNEKRPVEIIYDEVAETYDNVTPAFSQTADILLDLIDPIPVGKLLDACTGTGIFAIAAAKQKPSCQVTGIDISEGMLKQAEKKAQAANLKNISFQKMSLDSLDFPDNFFDISVCNFGIYFLEDMLKGLQQMRLKTVVNGNVILSVHATDAYLDLPALIKSDYETFVQQRESSNLPAWKPATSNWKILSNNDSIRNFCHQAGLSDVTISHERLGFEMHSPSQWWEMAWNGTYRGILKKLSLGELANFKEMHLKNVSEWCVKEGNWIDTDVIIVTGKKTG